MAIAVAPIAMPRLIDSAVKPAPSIPVGKMMPTPGSDGDGVGMAVAPSGLAGSRAGVAAVSAGGGWAGAPRRGGRGRAGRGGGGGGGAGAPPGGQPPGGGRGVSAP